MVSGPGELQREINDTASRLRLAAYEEGYNDGYEQAQAEEKHVVCECTLSDGIGDEVDYKHHYDPECCSMGCYHTLYLQRPLGLGKSKFGPNPSKGV